MNTDDDPVDAAAMVDVAFALSGSGLPREHRRLLADALGRALPWLADEPGAGPHPLKVDDGLGDWALLSRRTRLLLRVPRHRLAEALALQDTVLAVGEHRLALGAAQVRELLPWGTLYSHFVASPDADEARFVHRIEQELQGQDIRCRVVCGRARQAEGGAIRGFSLMLDGLPGAAALRLQSCGIGPLRGLGCGVLVPHKSAAAVGAAP